MTEAEIARAAIRYAGGLISLVGLAAEWKISKQRAHVHTQEDDFPAPITVEGTTRLAWFKDEANAWKASRPDFRYTS